MTYCLGMRTAGGLVMMADTRTNAGVDNISTFRKLQLFGRPGHGLIAVATAGSLSTTQATIQAVSDGIDDPATGKRLDFDGFTSIWEAVRGIGHALRQTRDTLVTAADPGTRLDATLLVGGSIAGEPLRLFMIYGAGNAIECGPDTPFLQIGETKYGKPILDRALTADTSLPDAVKIGIVSFNATMRSNLAVGLPIDLMVAQDGHPVVTHRIDEGDEYWEQVDARWARAMREALNDVPAPGFLTN